MIDLLLFKYSRTGYIDFFMIDFADDKDIVGMLSNLITF